MTGGKRILLLGSSVLMAGCVSDQNYHVRAIADPAAKFRFAGSLIAEGRAQLALGNVGLALETFRKAQREQPPSADTFAGIAACYAAMGRYDIARANYEFALAYAPSDRNLLTALASSLDQLGESAQAAQVRAEALRSAASSTPASQPVRKADAKQIAVTPLGVPHLSSVTVALAEPLPVSKKAERSASPSTPRASAAAEKKAAPTIGASLAAAPVIRKSPIQSAPKKIELAARLEAPMRSPTRAAQVPISQIVAPRPKTNIWSDPPGSNNASLAANATPKIPTPIETKPAPTKIVAHEAIAAVMPASVPLSLRTAVSQKSISPDPLRLSNVGLAGNAGPRIAISIEAPKPMATEMVARLPAAAVDATPPLAPARFTEALDMVARPKEQSRAPVPASQKRPAMPADRPREATIAQVEPDVEIGPHLQRLSLREVALVTEQAPVRRHTKPRSPGAPLPTPTDVAMNVSRVEPARHLASADAVSWVPLKYAPLQAPVQLLNAARTQSLAARTRVALLNHGWHKVRIGNAQRIRRHSLVLYASARWGVARRLAAYFGCKAVKSDKVHNVVVLLGRDATPLRRGSARA